MFISKFRTDWVTELENYSASPEENGNYLYMLLEGAFVQSLHKQFLFAETDLLFRYLPGFDDQAASVSPFVIRYDSRDALNRALVACDGWPMVAAIETPENLPEVAVRLAECCIVEADGQRFNLRFSDTRRIERVIAVLSSSQRSLFFGPASKWYFVGRDGEWKSLCAKQWETSDNKPPSLVFSTEQYGELIEDSLVDEILSVLENTGLQITANTLYYYRLVTDALSIVEGDLEFSNLVRWAHHAIIIQSDSQRALDVTDFAYWRNQGNDREDRA